MCHSERSEESAFPPLSSSTLVIEDPGSLFYVGTGPRACPSMAPAGVAAPRSRTLYGGEDCLSEASSAAQAIGTGAKAPEGPRPGANGFGSFCRNKRTSARGAETPQNPPLGARGRTPAKPSPSSCGAETPTSTTLRKSSASLRAGSVLDLRWRGGRVGESPRRRGAARRWPGVDTSAPPRRSAGRSARAGPTSGFAP